MQKQNESHHTSRVLRLLGIFLIGLLLTLTLTSTQTSTMLALEPTPPPRGIERDAPERTPVVRETRTLSNGVTSTLLEIPTEADTYIASERPNQNFGTDALYLGYNLVGDHFGAQRILIRFDVENALPDGAVIHDADLRLRLSFAAPGDDAPMPTVLRRLASGWTEDNITWATQPTWGEIHEDETEISTAEAWYGWDITELVSEWLNGTYDNHGVEIIGDERVQERERAFYSREADTYYPRLVVDYTVIDDNQPPIVTVDALPDYSPRSFTVSWSGSDQGEAGIAYYDVQYRVDDGDWTNWKTRTTATQAEFTNGENGRFYEFQARGVDDVGNTEEFDAPEASTTVDNQPPTSTVDPLPGITSTDDITVTWSGTDHGGAGIRHYDVRYRFNNGAWMTWQYQTTATSATLNNAEDGVYEFEVRATDELGQQEMFLDQAEAETAVDADPPYITPRVWLPLLLRNTAATY